MHPKQKQPVILLNANEAAQAINSLSGARREARKRGLGFSRNPDALVI
jgi:hypothetical protein